MSNRAEKIVCRASCRDSISADFWEASFSTATGVSTSLRRLFVPPKVYLTVLSPSDSSVQGQVLAITPKGLLDTLRPAKFASSAPGPIDCMLALHCVFLASDDNVGLVTAQASWGEV
jgi:hypothetical protein